jgi:nitrogen regulatory protein P-II 1
MKKIEAIVRVSKLEAVKDTLVARGVQGMTITEVHGHGVDQGQPITYRGITTTTGSVPRIKLETIVADEDVDAMIDAIFQAAHTREPGDGRILVVDLDSVTRIRTGEVEQCEPRASAHAGASYFDYSLRY